MKISQIFSLIAGFCIALSVGAQTQKEFTGSLLWKVSGKGLEKPSYIFGTHHLISSSYLDSIPGFYEAFNHSHQIVGEVTTSEMTEKGRSMIKYMMMPTDTTYQEILTPEDYNFLDSTLIAISGKGLNNLGKLKPAALNNYFTLYLHNKKYPQQNLANHEPMDLYIQRVGTEKSKNILALETVEKQCQILFNQTPINQQAETLICILKNADDFEKIMNDIDNYYRTGNLTGLNEIYHATDYACSSTEKEADAINKNRNQKWMKKIPTIISEKPAFIAVGCMHLAGKDGILYLLAEEGYTVEAVSQ